MQQHRLQQVSNTVWDHKLHSPFPFSDRLIQEIDLPVLLIICKLKLHVLKPTVYFWLLLYLSSFHDNFVGIATSYPLPLLRYKYVFYRFFYCALKSLIIVSLAASPCRGSQADLFELHPHFFPLKKSISFSCIFFFVFSTVCCWK